MAVVVFDPEELLITTDDAKAIGLMDPTTLKSNIASYDPTKLPANGRFQMTVREYFMKIPTHWIYYEAVYPEIPGNPPVPNPDLAALQILTDMTNVIFPTKGLIKKLFGAKVTPIIADDSDRTFEAQKVCISS